jgi:hypothetical protein
MMPVIASQRGDDDVGASANFSNNSGKNDGVLNKTPSPMSLRDRGVKKLQDGGRGTCRTIPQ